MEKIEFDLRWYRDKEKKFRLRKTGRNQRIVWSGKVSSRSGLWPYHLDAEALRQLPLRFQGVTNHETALAFVNDYGPLTREGLDLDSEQVPFEIWTFARTMRNALEACARKDTSGEVTERLRSGSESIAEFIGDLGRGAATLDAILEQHPVSGRLEIRLRPADLKQAIGFSVARRLIGPPSLRFCAQCGKMFEIGGGRATGKRNLKAQYCSDQCRIDHYNQQER